MAFVWKLARTEKNEKLQKRKDLVPATHSRFSGQAPKRLNLNITTPHPHLFGGRRGRITISKTSKSFCCGTSCFLAALLHVITKEPCFEFQTLQVRERWRMTILIYILRRGKIWSNHLIIQKLPWCNPSEKRGRSSINQLRRLKWREMCQTILKFMLVSEYHQMSTQAALMYCLLTGSHSTKRSQICQQLEGLSSSSGV